MKMYFIFLDFGGSKQKRKKIISLNLFAKSNIPRKFECKIICCSKDCRFSQVFCLCLSKNLDEYKGLLFLMQMALNVVNI